LTVHAIAYIINMTLACAASQTTRDDTRGAGLIERARARASAETKGE
jgi:hypothetical protein